MAELRRCLSLTDGVAIVIGIIIGSGIFIVPGIVAKHVPGAGAMLAVWVVAGFISLCGAIAFAELGAIFPSTGGQYVFLRETYGSAAAFLFGWTLLLIQRTGGTATLAAGFAIYLGQFVPLTIPGARLVSALVIVIFTIISYRGVQGAAWTQRVFTAAKLVAIPLLIVAVFATQKSPAPAWDLAPPTLAWGGVGIAMMACLWAYNGWFAMSFVAGELRNPERNLPRSLIWGTAVPIVLYLAANVAYMRVLTVEEMAATERVGAVVMERTFGAAGAAILSLTVLVSIAGAINAGILTAPRVYFAMARDDLFFERLAEVHPRFRTPAAAVALQGVWASILALVGSYEKLLSFTQFAAWIFYGMTVAAVIIQRRRQPDTHRPYRMWGYPITPALFVVAAVALVANTLVTQPVPAFAGLALIATGVPVYFYWSRRKRSVDMSHSQRELSLPPAP